MDEGRHAAPEQPLTDDERRLLEWKAWAEDVITTHVRNEDDGTCRACGYLMTCPTRDRAVRFLVHWQWLPVPEVLPLRNPGATLGIKPELLGAKKIA